MSHFYNTGVCDSDVMSHFPAFIYFPMLHQYRGTEGIFGLCFLPLVSLIEIPASPTVEQPLPGDAPLGPAVYPGEESTHSERCPPKLASHRAWETGAFPSPCSIAQGLYPWESFHHSLSAIHKQLWHTHMHTHTNLLPPCCTSTFLYFAPSFIILTFHTDFVASLLWLWAMGASVPSVLYSMVKWLPV